LLEPIQQPFQQPARHPSRQLGMLSARLEDRVARLEGDLTWIKCHISADHVLPGPNGNCLKLQSGRRRPLGEASEIRDHCHDLSRSPGRGSHAGSDDLQWLKEQMFQRLSAERIKQEKWQLDVKTELERASEKTSHAQMVMRKLVEAHGAFVEHVGSLETRFDEFTPQLQDLHQSMSRVEDDMEHRYFSLELQLSKVHEQEHEQPAHDLTGPSFDWTESLALGQLQVMVTEICSEFQEKLDTQMDMLDARVEAIIGERTGELNPRLASLEARLGSAPVPELVSGVSLKLHGRISTLQAMMERRCSNVESQICAARRTELRVP